MLVMKQPLNQGETGLTASCHRIHSHPLIQTESVSQFENCAVEYKVRKKRGERQPDRHRSRKGDTEQIFQKKSPGAHPRPGKR